MADTGFAPLSASNIQDALHNKLASGTLEVLPTDVNDVPIAGSCGGLLLAAAAVVTITNGALPQGTEIPVSANTLPANICFRLTVKNALGATIQILKRVQPTSDGLNLDTYTPNVAPQAIIQYGPPGPPGKDGEVTNAAMRTAIDTTVDGLLSPLRNLIDPSTYQDTYTYSAASNSVRQDTYSGAGWVTAHVLPGTTYTCVGLLADGNSDHGSIEFDGSGNPIQSTFHAVTGYSDPYTFTTSANTHSIGFWVKQSQVQATKVSLTKGTAVPNPILPYGVDVTPYLPELVNLAKALPQLASNPLAVATAIQQAISATAPQVVNLYDHTRSIGGACWSNVTGGVRPNFFGNSSSYFAEWTGFISIVPGETYTWVNQGFTNNSNEAVQGLFDANYQPIAGVSYPWGQMGTNPVFVAPSNAAYFAANTLAPYRVPTWDSPAERRAMLLQGTAIPAVYLPFAGNADPLQARQQSPWYGKRVGFITDSYGAQGEWQQRVAFAHGMVWAFNDSRVNRPWGPFPINTGSGNGGGPFECYGGTSTGSYAPNTSFGSWGDASSCVGYAAPGAAPLTPLSRPAPAAGTTLASMLATLDLLIIELGTNDYADTIGTSADAAATASLHGYLRTALDDLQQHYPMLRIVLVTPVNIASRAPGLAAVRQAMLEQGTLHGTPCLDNFTNAGFNLYNTRTGSNAPPGMLTDSQGDTQLMVADGIHPCGADHTFTASSGATVAGIGYATFAAHPIRKLLEITPFTFGH